MADKTKADAILEMLREIAKILGEVNARTKVMLAELAVPEGLEDPAPREGE